jgi:hypothetical protein
MLGLLDIFGTGGPDTLSRLGMSPEAIQRSRDDAQAQALYSLAGSLLSGGPTGLSIVRGLQQGSQAYKNAMQGQLQEQFQGMQVQDLLRKRKQEEEALALQQQARMRQQMIDRAVAGSFQPGMAAVPAQMVEEDGRFIGETPAVAGRAAGLDLQSLAPVLMASPEGRKTLGELVASQKALRPETFSLAEGATQFERDPFTGQVRQVASGAPKPEAMPTSLRQRDRATLKPVLACVLAYALPCSPSCQAFSRWKDWRFSPENASFSRCAKSAKRTRLPPTWFACWKRPLLLTRMGILR